MPLSLISSPPLLYRPCHSISYQRVLEIIGATVIDVCIFQDSGIIFQGNDKADKQNAEHDFVDRIM